MGSKEKNKFWEGVAFVAALFLMLWAFLSWLGELLTTKPFG